ncbi:hypothetical protein HCX49_21730 [Sphingobacterium kitahiroshimense]|uniref:hypothetical protein n=1 Tax=Sphingobacterium sp. B16(2022) TaxID=2914044 RepID=UPI00143A60C3|nr:hypothetical protein [Sphingobacterium sp. B16(2022)]NJI75821.1 hypothetical protein [Sphingobacterium sp. B16(2022)]
MTLLDPNFNGLPPVTDWEKVFIALQQANEKVFRGASAKEFGKQVIGDVAIQGADFEDLPIATSSAPVVLPIPQAEMKFGFLANGRYTQPNGPDLEYSTTQWGLTLFDGVRWIKKFTLDLPDNSANAPDWSLGLYKKNDIVTNASKIWIALENTSQEPKATSTQWKLVDESSQSFTVEKNSQNLTATIVNGFLTRSGGSNNNAVGRRTATANVNMYKITYGKAYEYDGEIDLTIFSTMAGILYKDENFALLDYDASETKVYKGYRLNYPPGTVYIAGCAIGSDPVIKEVDERLVLKSSALPKESRGQVTLIVDPDAELTENVFHNLSDAIARYKEYDSAIIRAKGGRYAETLNLATIGDLRLESSDGIPVKIAGGEFLTGWEKTAGTLNVYQINYNKIIPETTQDKTKRIFENGRLSLAIDPAKYHPLHRGMTHMSPFSEIKQAASLTECDSNKGSFFHSEGVLYIHTNDSINPNTSGFTYENAVRPNTSWGSDNTGRKIELNNIIFEFSNNDGCHIYGRHVIRNNVTVLGSASEGINDDNCTGVSRGDRVISPGADCINGHYTNYNTDVRNDQYTFYYYNVYAINGEGDVISHHARSNVFISNILGERCNRRGIIAFGGAIMTVNGGRFRDNLMEGCMAQNDSESGNSGKISTTVHLINVVSENHSVNFRTTEGATIVAEWTRSKGATVNDINNAGIFEYHDFGVDTVSPNNIVGAGTVRKTEYKMI